jgi:hypothetical protein
VAQPGPLALPGKQPDECSTKLLQKALCYFSIKKTIFSPDTKRNSNTGAYPYQRKANGPPVTPFNTV